MPENKPLGKPVIEGGEAYKREGGCVHTIKIYFKDIKPIGPHLARRTGGIGAVLSKVPIGKEEDLPYEFKATADIIPRLVDYVRSYAKRRGGQVIKVETDFMCDEEVLEHDARRMK